MRSEIKRIVREQKAMAQQDTTIAHEAAILAAIALIPGTSEDEAPLPNNYASGETFNINARRPVSESTGEIIDRIISSVGNDISDSIDEASGSKTISETVKNITAAVADNDLSGALEEVGQGDLVSEDSDFSMDSLSELYNNTKRVLSHEAAVSADETGKSLVALNPAVDFAKWELSFRHNTLSSSPDVCDVFASIDPYGYGEGVWHKKTIPSLPHPHCECRQSVILADPSDWGSSREVPDEPSFSKDAIEGLMEDVEGKRTVTEAHVDNQSSLLKELVSKAHENPRGI
jgi:hypothetical protein